MRKLSFLVLTAALAFSGAVSRAQAPTESGTITSVEQPLEVLPRDLISDLKGSKADEALAKVPDLFQQKVDGREITLEGVVDRSEKMNTPATAKAERYRFKLQDERVRHAGLMFEAHVWVTVDSEDNEKVAALKKGARVSFTGKVANAGVTRGKPYGLRLMIRDAKLK